MRTTSVPRGSVRVLGAAAALLLLVSLAGCSSGGSSSTSKASAEVRAAETARLKALVDADLPTLRRLHADDFELVSADGSVLTKATTLDLVGTGALDYLAFTPVSELRVRVHGDSAVVRYKSQLDVKAEGSGRLTHYAWHTDLYERRDGRWQVVWSQATSVGRLPEPTAS